MTAVCLRVVAPQPAAKPSWLWALREIPRRMRRWKRGNRRRAAAVLALKVGAFLVVIAGMAVAMSVVAGFLWSNLAGALR